MRFLSWPVRGSNFEYSTATPIASFSPVFKGQTASVCLARNLGCSVSHHPSALATAQIPSRLTTLIRLIHLQPPPFIKMQFAKYLAFAIALATHGLALPVDER